MVYSTISVSPRVKKQLEGFRIYRRETYDDMLMRLMEDAGWQDDEGEFSAQAKQAIKKGLREIREGKTVPFDYVLSKHGIGKK